MGGEPEPQEQPDVGRPASLRYAAALDAFAWLHYPNAWAAHIATRIVRNI
jgi:hypothetical protein